MDDVDLLSLRCCKFPYKLLREADAVERTLLTYGWRAELVREHLNGAIHAGKTGISGRCFTGRIATPDRCMIELSGSLPGYGVSVLLSDVEVVR